MVRFSWVEIPDMFFGGQDVSASHQHAERSVKDANGIAAQPTSQLPGSHGEKSGASWQSHTIQLLMWWYKISLGHVEE